MELLPQFTANFIIRDGRMVGCERSRDARGKGKRCARVVRRGFGFHPSFLSKSDWTICNLIYSTNTIQPIRSIHDEE